MTRTGVVALRQPLQGVREGYPSVAQATRAAGKSGGIETDRGKFGLAKLAMAPERI
jgi:hypothetical protein